MKARPVDAALVEQARAGAPQALAALYETYGRRLFGVAYRVTRSREDAADVVQDVFVGLPEALRNYEEHGSLDWWLARVTMLTALLTERRRKRMKEVHAMASQDTRMVARPQAVVDRISLDNALEQVPAEFRTVFLLKEVDGYSHAEIAELLGITRGASQMRLYRARQMLIKLLETG
ncbi:MAG: sigma-70 family RNA polymerase sigma factor [Gemmatimonadota bacterium]|jgi:RNA polymerase sigma factor (sigma-70 family)